MSRAVLRVVAYGSTSEAVRAHRFARSAATRTDRSKPARSRPAEFNPTLVGQSQSSGVLRPTNRGSIPIRS
jgi:hypothetical protein